MKKPAALLLTLALALSLSACGAPAAMRLEPAALTGDEEALLSLVLPDTDVQIFDYTLDNSIRSIDIRCYTLGPDLQWERILSGEGGVMGPSGRIAVWTGRDGPLRIVRQEDGARYAWTEEDDLLGTLPAVGSTWAGAQGAAIVSGEELPLALMLFSDGPVRSPDPSLFFTPEELADCDLAVAYTAVFSDQPLSSTRQE